ncbi:MAG: TonB-dependent receptor, partial [Burkholderiaceae bacterium]|nr:TonB-dependent receptor [Burkholderiaceae bacterium]
TTQNDGASVHWSGTYGFGDLDSDGHNAYFHLEASKQNDIMHNDRGGILSNRDLRVIGGPDLRGGIVQPGNVAPSNFAQTLVGIVAPLDAGNAQAGPFQLLPGCAAGNLNYSGGCTWDTLRFRQIQPATQNLNLSARFTNRLASGWQAGLDIQGAQSWAEQRFDPTYVPQPTQTDPTTSNVVLPASHPDNPFGPGQGAFLYYTFGDIGARHSTYRTDLLRTVATISGAVSAWDLEAGVGYARALTHIRYEGSVRTSALASLLASGSYRIGVNAALNDASVYEELAPTTEITASTLLQFADLRGSRELVALPGGPLTLGLGVETRRQGMDNPGQPYALEGDVLGNATAFVHGSRSAHSLYGELQAPVARSVSIDLALRHEEHPGIGSSTAPKVGMHWRARPGFALRGTHSRGFRVPSLVESGNSGFNFYTNFNDPERCPTTNLPSDCNGIIRLSITGNPALEPETSKNWTLGAVFEPSKNTMLAVDYYRIDREHEIVVAPFAGAETVHGGPDLGNPQLPPPIAGFNLPFVNANSTLTSGFDLDLRHRLTIKDAGQLTGRLLYTRILDYRQDIDGVRYEFAGTHGPTSLSGNVGTPAHRAQLALALERGPFEVGTELNYVSGVSATDPVIGDACLALETNPDCRIGSFTSVNLSGAWRFSDGLQLIANVQNLFDREPPLDTVTYGGVNYNPSLHQAGAIGRAFFIGLTHLCHFSEDFGLTAAANPHRCWARPKK